MTIKEKCLEIYNSYIKGNVQNMVLVVCISGFIFGFLMGYLMTESENMEIAQVEKASGQNLKQINDEDKIVKISEEVSPSVVVVKNKIYVSEGREKVLTDRGVGSGVVYNSDGYVITNQHVVRGASVISVTLEDGQEYEAQIIGEDEKTDIAVIKIDKKNLKEAQLGDSDKLKVGETVVAIGSPLGEEFAGSVTSGIISYTERNLNLGNRNAKLIQTDTVINPGSSGGALINKEGEVIGINSLKISSSKVEGMSFAIPINIAKSVAQEILEDGFVKRAWLGLGLAESKEPQGVYIGGIMKDGPADNGEILQGDIIVKAGNKVVRNIADLSSIIENHSPNDVVELTVLRNREKLIKKITLGETPKSSPF